MKKLMSILAAGMFALLLSSCGSNSPEAVVKKALNATLDGDGETYTELMFRFDESEWEGSDKQREKQMAKKAREIEKQAKRMAKADDDEKIDKFEIIDVTIDFDDEDRAEVEVKFFFEDGHTRKTTFYVRRTTEGNWRLVS